MSTTEDNLAKAQEKLARAKAYHDKMLVIKTAESEIPAIWDTGQISMVKLADEYGISAATVRRILVDAGREVHRFRKLTHEERAEVVALLKNGQLPEHIAEVYQCSKSTIRRVGVETGILQKGIRKPRRSDEEYDLIRAFDAEARKRFAGAGLYNLGMGLRTHDNKKRAQARALEASPPVVIDGDHENDPAPEPQPAPAKPKKPVNTKPERIKRIGDGEEDAAAVTGPFADSAPSDPSFSF